MLEINIPDAPASSVSVTLGGKLYEFEFKYNSTTTSHYLTIRQAGKLLVSSLKLLPNVNLLRKYKIPEFDHGVLFVLKLEKTEESAGRNNIGIGKAYSLLYVSNNE